MNRINHTPQFLYFKNQQSSLINHQSVAEKTRGLSPGIPAKYSKVSGTLRCAVRDKAETTYHFIQIDRLANT